MYKVQIQYEHFLKKNCSGGHLHLTWVIFLYIMWFIWNLYISTTLWKVHCYVLVLQYIIGWNVLLLSTYYESFISFFLFIFQSKNYLLKLGQFHRHVGVPSDYLGVMGSIFVHAVKPYLENHNQWNEKIEDAWMELFSHIARVMRHGHIHYFSEPTGRELTSTQSVSL